MNNSIMLYNSYEDASLKLIKAGVKCQQAGDKIGYAKQRFLLAMLRVMYYEQFLADAVEHNNLAKFVNEQIDNSWQLVGEVRDFCDEAGFDWKSCKVPELAAYLK